MIEIECPNCQARYQLPDGSIGPDGRKVSCSACSHKWQARPASSAAVQQPPPPQPAPEQPAPHQPSPAEVMAAAVAPAPGVDGGLLAGATPQPPPATGDRDEQMAAIRQMLTDLKESADSAPQTVEPEAAPSTSPGDPRSGDLKSHIEDVDNLARMVKGEPTASNYDAVKLRKRHEKRAKRLQRTRDRRKRSGAFITGFTLVATVSAAMVGLYVMQPQIIAASPEMAPALTEYVTTVDRYRIELAETTTEWKTWVTERIEGLSDNE